MINVINCISFAIFMFAVAFASDEQSILRENIRSILRIHGDFLDEVVESFFQQGYVTLDELETLKDEDELKLFGLKKMHIDRWYEYFNERFTTHTFPDGKYTKTISGNNVQKNINGGFATIWFNYYTQPLDIYWMGHDGKEVFKANMSPGSEMHQTTFYGHKFFAKDSEGNILQTLVMDNNETYIILTPQKEEI